MRFEDFVDGLARKARHEKSPGAIDRNEVLSRIAAMDDDGGNASNFRAPPWLLALSGAAASVSLAMSMEWLTLMSEPLGLLLGFFELMPWEVMS